MLKNLSEKVRINDIMLLGDEGQPSTVKSPETFMTVHGLLQQLCTVQNKLDNLNRVKANILGLIEDSTDQGT